MNCGLTDNDRKNGLLCRGIDCVPCKKSRNNFEYFKRVEATKKSLEQFKPEEIPAVFLELTESMIEGYKQASEAEAKLTKTQSLLGEAVELLKWLYEREEHINEVNNAVENFIRKYEGQKGE